MADHFLRRVTPALVMVAAGVVFLQLLDKPQSMLPAAPVGKNEAGSNTVTPSPTPSDPASGATTQEGSGGTGATKPAPTSRPTTTRPTTTRPSPKPSATKIPAAPVTPTSVPTPATAPRSLTGSAVSTRYGIVQVRVLIDASGTITDVIPVSLPTGRNSQYSNYAEPILRRETISAQSANIQAVSGASYTSDGYKRSLASALAQK